MASRRQFINALHPRDLQGRFARKGGGSRLGSGAVILRASLRSATVGYRHSVNLPRGYSVHLTALARIEKDSAKIAYLQRLTDKVLLRIVDQLPTARLQNMARQAITKRQLQGPKGVTLALPARRGRRARSVRASREVGAARAVTRGRRVRRRQPRAVQQRKAIEGRKV